MDSALEKYMTYVVLLMELLDLLIDLQGITTLSTRSGIDTTIAIASSGKDYPFLMECLLWMILSLAS